MPITRPVLRYPGGKYKLAKWIISHFPQHEFYVEPYGGAGSVLMAKPKVQGEIYNDLDGDVCRGGMSMLGAQVFYCYCNLSA